MPHFSEKHPRFITNIENGFLVVIPVNGKRYITRTVRDPNATQETLLARAVKWRDKAYRRLYKCDVPARSFHINPREDTVTGIPGVRYVLKHVRKKRRDGTIATYHVPVILAEVHTIPGENYRRPRGSRSRLFSLNKYDWDEAIALAAAWREAICAELVNLKMHRN